MNKIDELEKKVERKLPKVMNLEAKRHYLLYALGILLIAILAGYFAITYARDNREAKRNQDLIQQQIDLQKEQLEIQAKQLESAKDVATTMPVTSAPSVSTSKSSTPSAPTCNEAKQNRQENFFRELQVYHMNSKTTAQANLETAKIQLADPKTVEENKSIIEERIRQAYSDISSAEYNYNSATRMLSNAENCKLYDDKEISGWAGVFKIPYSY